MCGWHDGMWAQGGRGANHGDLQPSLLSFSIEQERLQRTVTRSQDATTFISASLLPSPRMAVTRLGVCVCCDGLNFKDWLQVPLVQHHRNFKQSLNKWPISENYLYH